MQFDTPNSTANDQLIQNLYEDINTTWKSENTLFKMIKGDFKSKIGNANTNNILKRGKF